MRQGVRFAHRNIRSFDRINRPEVRGRRPEGPEQRDMEGRPRPPSVGYSVGEAHACLTIYRHKLIPTIFTKTEISGPNSITHRFQPHKMKNLFSKYFVI